MPDFDPTAIAIGGVGLVYLIPRLIEFLKVAVKLKGQPAIWSTAGLIGFLFAGVYAAMAEGLVPDIALPWIRVFVLALGGLVMSAAAVGEYELQAKRH